MKIYTYQLNEYFSVKQNAIWKILLRAMRYYTV